MRRCRARVVGEARVADAALVARIAQGDASALGELYDRYAVTLLRFVSRMAPAGEAEDIVQATFVRVMRIADAFDSDAESARPWLFAVAMRVTQERRRSLRRFGAAMLRLAQVPRDAVRQRADEGRDLERGLSRLSDAKRAVLVLSEIEGFTCEQIAAMLDVPVGTVWTRLHHARRELRAFLGEEAP